MSAKAASVLDDAAVEQWLRQHPGFFLSRSALISELQLPHESGSAVSLIERQVRILRDRNVTMRKRLNELLQAARDNDTLFAKTRSLTLTLLDVSSWQELNEVLATNMLIDFEADYVCCHLQGADPRLDYISGSDDELPTTALNPGNQAVCMALREDEMKRLFPLQSPDTAGSVVFIPILRSSLQGCLVVGSRDPSRFSADMETLFVRYIGDVLSRTVAGLS
ncbi:MAG: DUF484 family protein [Gammaproteobacteria bacterium]|nr:DUF484 family protein [Gammaproteobacteria bacterium]